MNEALKALRSRIDAIDHQLLDLLRERQEAVRAIGRIKAERGDPIVQPERERQMYDARRAAGARLELDPDYVEALWRLIHDESCRQQALLRSESPAHAEARGEVPARPLAPARAEAEAPARAEARAEAEAPARAEARAEAEARAASHPAAGKAIDPERDAT
jgi:chorismate mutase-like protein